MLKTFSGKITEQILFVAQQSDHRHFSEIEKERETNPFGGVRSTEQENFAIRTSLNLTVTPRQGSCGGRISSLDGRNGYFFSILSLCAL